MRRPMTYGQALEHRELGDWPQEDRLLVWLAGLQRLLVKEYGYGIVLSDTEMERLADVLARAITERR